MWMRLFRTVAVIAPMSLALMACHPWPASYGVPQARTVSPASGKDKKTAPPATNGSPATASHSTPNPNASPSPTVSAVPAVDPSLQESLTLLSKSEHDKQQAGTGFAYDNRTLTLTFETKISISLPAGQSALDDSRKIYLQNGQWMDASKLDTRAMACELVFSLYDATDTEIVIPADTSFILSRKTSGIKNGSEWSLLKADSAKTPSGDLVQMRCAGFGGSFTIQDLVDAFGKDEKGQPRVKAALQIPAPPSPAPAPAGARRPASEDGDVADVVQHTEKEFTTERFRKARPNFGVQLSGSPSALSGMSVAQQGVSGTAFLLELEYQPAFLQRYGVLGIGPSIGVYPMGTVGTTNQRVTSSPFSIYSYGGQIRYQFRYWDNQIVVPSAAYQVEALRYNLIDGGSGQLTLAGATAGLEIFLNPLAPTQAVTFFQDVGVARTYAIAELMNLSGSDQNVAVSGNSFYFGLRFEF